MLGAHTDRHHRSRRRHVFRRASLPWSDPVGEAKQLYLESLQLTGFKTFAGMTRIEFAEGMTAIVGANGSGKSNLVDALKWVLGEQSMRDLRSRRAEDVIYAGSTGRRPASMAEVTVRFDNEARWLPIDSVEVN